MTLVYISFFDPINKREVALLKEYAKTYDKVVLLPLDEIGGRNIVGSDKDRINILHEVINEYKLNVIVDDFDVVDDDDTFVFLLKYISNKYGSDGVKILLTGINNIAFKPLLGPYEFHQGVFDFTLNPLSFSMFTPIVSIEDHSSNVNIDKFGTINVPKSAYDYIISKKIYFVQKLYSMEDLERFKHSISVANLCYNIALGNHMDEDKAFIAGLLHDCGKDVEQMVTNELMHRYFIDDCVLLPFAYHQFVGSFLAEREFGIKDSDILNAIRYHCTGRSDMSKLEKIIYASDKTDPLRGYDSEKFIADCEKDIDSGFIEVLKDNYKYLVDKKSDYSNKYSTACFKFYLGVDKK
jgi:nicotinate-nucleotide adenylyltransferase